MNCPYCKGDIPADAVKCMHCGEWVRPEGDPARPGPARSPGEMFGRVWKKGGLTPDDVTEGVRWYVEYRIIMAVVGAVVGLILLLVVIIPGFSRSNDQSPFGPRDITCVGSQATFGPDGFPTCVK